jgi:hypothetical protein
VTVLDEPLLPEEDAARELKVKPQTMAAWRYRGIGPRYIKVGKLVFYTPSFLREYIQGRVVQPTGVVHEQVETHLHNDARPLGQAWAPAAAGLHRRPQVLVKRPARRL